MKTEKNNILTFLFWANFAAFAVHVMDEAFIGGGFVDFIHRHFWPGFETGDFYTANAIWLILITAGNILYDLFGKKLVAIPLFFVWERSLNALFHVGTTLCFNEYSPGVLTSFLFPVILYLICKYGLLRKQFHWRVFLGSGIGALAFETVFISSMWWAH